MMYGPFKQYNEGTYFFAYCIKFIASIQVWFHE